MILVEIAGFLGADSEERFTPNGKRVVSLRVATKVRSKDKDETVWWRVNIWGDRFDKMLPYLKKGSAVIIIGEMGKPETYTSKDGKTEVSLTLSAEIIKFSPFGKPGGKEGGNEHVETRAQHVPQQQREMLEEEMAFAGSGGSGFTNDDLPF